MIGAVQIESACRLERTAVEAYWRLLSPRQEAEAACSVAPTTSVPPE